MKRLYFAAYILLITGFMTACYTPSKMSMTNISSNYQDQSRNLNVNISAYNTCSDSTRIYYKFNTGGLFFQKDMKKNYFFAQYLIKYDLYNISDIKKIIDSASFIITDSVNYNQNTDIIDSLNICLKEPNNYILSLTIIDLNKKFVSTNYLNIYKNNILNRNNFVIRDEKYQPMVQNYISNDKHFRIFMREKQIYKLFVKYYKPTNTIADPPFTLGGKETMSLSADSIFSIDINDGCSAMLNFTKNGIYHFQSDTSKKDGFTLFRFNSDFPKITSAEEMLSPLRYISTKSEFNDLSLMKNTKGAIDNFWLDKAGNPDRAKEMIKVFYNRVQDANRYFSSYTEGWKTDRGMIYIVFGPPYSVYRSPENETWYYGEDRNILSMTLDFKKTQNPFTENDYTLDRSPEYKDVWYSAVESWRK